MKKEMIFVLILYLLAFVQLGIAQNSMNIKSISGQPGDTITIELEINNSDDFVAFQTDIQLPDQVQYLVNSAQLTNRANGHHLSANLLTGNVLRVVTYSLNQTPFIGNNGSVLYFRVILGSQPGNYTLTLLDPIISDDNSMNILNNSSDGSVTILASDIQTSTSILDFGETPLQSYMDRSFTISNFGNIDLQISKITTDNSIFKILGDTVFTIPAGGSRSVTVRFQPHVKGTFTSTLSIHSNDPDESFTVINLNAVAFAINELRMKNISGRSGYPIWIDFSINNMEPFVGFQFDLVLPSVLTFMPDSIKLTNRKSDHVVSFNMITDNKLRVVAYSPGKQPFSGSDGNVVSIGFILKGTGGNYNIGLENVIISDAEANNIVSAYYPSYVNIKSPNIFGSTAIQFSEVSVLDTAEVVYPITNNGNDTLIVQNITSTQSFFWNDTPLPQIIPPGGKYNFILKFHNLQKGSYSDRFTIRSNDPDDDPFYVDVLATTFAPNYLIVRDTSSACDDTVTIKIDVENYEQFVAFQFDLTFPDSLIYIDNSARLTSRKQDHCINVSLINDHTIRVFAFSMTQAHFLGDSGTVTELDFVVRHITGNFPLIVSNAILSNASSENILKSAQNGQLYIFNPLTGIADQFTSKIPEQFVLFQNYPNPFNPETHIRFGLPRSSRVRIEVLNILGQRVATLLDAYKPAGYHEVVWDASNMSSGVYIYRINTRDYVKMRKMILMR